MKKKEYVIPMCKTVEVKFQGVLASSPGGNEDPEDFPINGNKFRGPDGFWNMKW